MLAVTKATISVHSVRLSMVLGPAQAQLLALVRSRRDWRAEDVPESV